MGSMMGRKKKAKNPFVIDPMSPSTNKVDEAEAEYMGTAIGMLDQMFKGGSHGPSEKSPVIRVSGETSGPSGASMLTWANVSVSEDGVINWGVKSVRLVIEAGDVAILHVETYTADSDGTVSTSNPTKIRSYPIKNFHIETGGLSFGYTT
jgi:hypothetical protein